MTETEPRPITDLSELIGQTIANAFEGQDEDGFPVHIVFTTGQEIVISSNMTEVIFIFEVSHARQ